MMHRLVHLLPSLIALCHVHLREANIGNTCGVWTRHNRSRSGVWSMKKSLLVTFIVSFTGTAATLAPHSAVASMTSEYNIIIYKWTHAIMD